MKIYTGTVQDVTEDLLWTWLLRDFLNAEITPVDAAIAPVGYWGVVTSRKVQAVVERTPYLTRCVVYSPAAVDETPSNEYGAIELAQWRAAEVKITFMDVQPIFAEELRRWLILRYGCTVHEMQLTPSQEQEVEEATTLEEKIAVLTKFVELAAKINAPLDLIADQVYRSQRELRRMSKQVEQETGKRIWPNRARGRKTSSSRRR